MSAWNIAYLPVMVTCIFFYNLGFDTDPTEERHFGEYIPVI